jgi:hypothetical protein
MTYHLTYLLTYHDISSQFRQYSVHGVTPLTLVYLNWSRIHFCWVSSLGLKFNCNYSLINSRLSLRSKVKSEIINVVHVVRELSSVICTLCYNISKNKFPDMWLCIYPWDFVLFFVIFSPKSAWLNLLKLRIRLCFI